MTGSSTVPGWDLNPGPLSLGENALPTELTRTDVIWKGTDLPVKYKDMFPEVKMYLLNVDCCHVYGS